MLLRMISVPLRYTTAPSSRRRFSVTALSDAVFTVTCLRKYVVRYFDVEFGPKDTTVASSPSP